MKIWVEANKCERCGNVWLAQNPARCGKCKSPAWDKSAARELRDAPVSFSDPAREQHKAERRERKAILAASVVEALPARSEEPPVTTFNGAAVELGEPRRTYCPRHRPKYCEPSCPHRIPA